MSSYNQCSGAILKANFLAIYQLCLFRNMDIAALGKAMWLFSGLLHLTITRTSFIAEPKCKIIYGKSTC